MDVARTMALRSRCSRDQVGAVVVSVNNRIVDTGYNGPPRRHHPSRDGSSCVMWCHRAMAVSALISRDPSYDDCPSLHAEANALMFSDRRLRESGTIYITSGTCGGCAKLVANSGLVRAVYADAGNATHRDSERWYDFLRDADIEVTLV